MAGKTEDDTMVRKDTDTMIVNSDVESELGTMIINDTDEEDATMKSKNHTDTRKMPYRESLSFKRKVKI